MPIDASIPLSGTPQPSAVQTIGGLLNIQRTQQAIQGQQIANQSAQGNLDETMALRNLVKDPRVLNADGSIDPDKYRALAPIVAPTQGNANSSALSAASTANTGSQAASYHFTKEQGQDAQSAIGGVVNDARMASNDPLKVTDALSEAEDNMITAGVPKAKAKLAMTQFYTMAKTDPGNVRNAIRNLTLGQQGAGGQYNAGSPQAALVPSANGTQPTNVNPNIPGMPVGAPMGPAITPPNQTMQTPTGSTVLGNTATGQVHDFGGSNQMAIPAGYSMDQRATINAQRDAARAAIVNAPNQSDLNHGIYQIATDPKMTTGKFAGFLADKASWVPGLDKDTDEATRRDTLAKYLAQSNSQLAQSMGPHTNAGLDQANTSGGTVDTSPRALANIAARNQALLKGSLDYQQGLETAINARTANGDPYPERAKQTFDQQWGNNFDVRMTKWMFLNEVGDKAGADALLAGIGPKGSTAFNDFKQKASAINKLKTTGGL